MVCPWWLCYSFDNPLRRFIHDPESLLAPSVKPGMTVVDVGCGMGYFTIPLARITGPGGKVIAADLQQRMLDALVRRAEKAGVADRVIPHRSQIESLSIEGPADFALVFWMAHEVPDKPRFFREIFVFLKQGGRLLLVEPKYHVPVGDFNGTLAVCREAGFSPVGEPAVALSRAVLLGKSS
jgi:ubiquinone/menaquinone biosynthesis C-methylase UbiE